MKKKFFEVFRSQEKNKYKTIGMSNSEWQLIEAYRLYGSAQSGNQIVLTKLIKEIVLTHISSDKNFNEAQWLRKVNLIHTNNHEDNNETES